MANFMKNTTKQIIKLSNELYDSIILLPVTTNEEKSLKNQIIQASESYIARIYDIQNQIIKLTSNVNIPVIIDNIDTTDAITMNDKINQIIELTKSLYTNIETLNVTNKELQTYIVITLQNCITMLNNIKRDIAKLTNNSKRTVNHTINNMITQDCTIVIMSGFYEDEINIAINENTLCEFLNYNECILTITPHSTSYTMAAILRDELAQAEVERIMISFDERIIVLIINDNFLKHIS